MKPTIPPSDGVAMLLRAGALAATEDLDSKSALDYASSGEGAHATVAASSLSPSPHLLRSVFLSLLPRILFLPLFLTLPHLTSQALASYPSSPANSLSPSSLTLPLLNQNLPQALYLPLSLNLHQLAPLAVSPPTLDSVSSPIAASLRLALLSNVSSLGRDAPFSPLKVFRFSVSWLRRDRAHAQHQPFQGGLTQQEVALFPHNSAA